MCCALVHRTLCVVPARHKVRRGRLTLLCVLATVGAAAGGAAGGQRVRRVRVCGSGSGSQQQRWRAVRRGGRPQHHAQQSAGSEPLGYGGGQRRGVAESCLKRSPSWGCNSQHVSRATHDVHGAAMQQRAKAGPGWEPLGISRAGTPRTCGAPRCSAMCSKPQDRRHEGSGVRCSLRSCPQVARSAGLLLGMPVSAHMLGVETLGQPASQLRWGMACGRSGWVFGRVPAVAAAVTFPVRHSDPVPSACWLGTAAMAP